MIDVEDLSDGQLITTNATELHAEDHAMNMPKMEFSANKILAGRFSNNPSDDILDHPTKHCFILLRFAKSDRLNSEQSNLSFQRAWLNGAVTPNQLIVCG